MPSILGWMAHNHPKLKKIKGILYEKKNLTKLHCSRHIYYNFIAYDIYIICLPIRNLQTLWIYWTLYPTLHELKNVYKTSFLNYGHLNEQY